MRLIVEVLGQTLLLMVSGAIFSFIVWLLVRKKTSLEVVFGKYGELLAYAGLLLVVIVVLLIRQF